MARRRDCSKCGKRGHPDGECTQVPESSTSEHSGGVRYRDKKDSGSDTDQEPDYTKLMASLTINPNEYHNVPVKVTIPGQEVQPISDFSQLPISDQLRDNVHTMWGSKLSALQRHALPLLYGCKDLLARCDPQPKEAATLLLPFLPSYFRQFALVITPTQTLASLLKEEVEKLARNLPVQIVSEGDELSQHILKSMRSGCYILIGTLGWVKQLIQNNTLSLASVEFLALLKTDNMAPEDINFLSAAPGSRQTLIISSNLVEEMAGKLLKSNYRLVEVINGQASVKVPGHTPIKAIKRFTDLALGPKLQANIVYKKPTPVQSYALPIICAGKDVMACAQTGTGKTAAFVLPMVKLINECARSHTQNSRLQHPEALIITPTRELAIQIHKDIVLLARGTQCKPCLAYGGARLPSQKEKIARGCNILVGTPGRVRHFIEDETISLKAIKFFVLDEADRMLDMGFKRDIDFFAKHPELPPKSDRQTLMFSATYPEEVQKVAKQFLDDDYRFITVGEIGSAQPDVSQYIFQVATKQKTPKLIGILKDILEEKLEKGGLTKTLVFVQTKKNAQDIADMVFDKLYDMLCAENVGEDILEDFGVTSIHGDKTQAKRERALEGFRNGSYRILVATAVAARGLDISGVTHVINYDLPDRKVRHSLEEYVNKIGRTGRAGNKGVAISFFQPDRDRDLSRSLVQMMSEAQQDVPEWLQKLATLPDAPKQKKKRVKKSNRTNDGTALTEAWDSKQGPAGAELWDEK